MASYYFPLRIQDRRTHICHLNDDGIDNHIEFITPMEAGKLDLFSIDTKVKIISGTGSDYDQNLQTYKFQSRVIDDKGEDLEVEFRIHNNREKDLEFARQVDKFQTGKKGDTLFMVLRSKGFNWQRVRVKIVYEVGTHEEGGTNNEFVTELCFHIPKRGGEHIIYRSAIDFGSDSTQIGVIDTEEEGETKVNRLSLISELRTYYSEYTGTDRFWQSQVGGKWENDETLFRSNFFVNPNAVKGFDFGEAPNKHGRDSLLYLLVPFKVGAHGESYLMPNLKLIEMLGQKIGGSEGPKPKINLGDPKNNPLRAKGRNLVDPVFIKAVRRLVLSKFLRCIFDNAIWETTDDKYLYITLLAPNVYGQKMISQITEDLYKDFNKIIEEDEYESVKGIEIDTISESDASLIGMSFKVANDNSIVQKKEGGHYLIIDSGKGTTDYSVMRQDGGEHRYKSIFRSGLPGAGQYITYGFIELIQSHLDKPKEWLKDEIRSYESTFVLSTMDKLERAKQIHSSATSKKDITELSEHETADLSALETAESLRDIINFLDNWVIEPNLPIQDPGNIIKNRTDRLVQKIVQDISNANIDSFDQVLLAGRAFLFEPFTKSLKEALTQNESFTVEPESIIFYPDDSKHSCIYGALKGHYASLNTNSGLVSTPVPLGENVKAKPRVKKTGLFGKFNNSSQKSFTTSGFIMSGLDLDKKVSKVRIGPKTYGVEHEDSDVKVNLFFTGKEFILRGAESNIKLRLEDLNLDMVEETLFPYAEMNVFGSGKVSPDESEKPKRHSGYTSQTNTSVPKLTTNKKADEEERGKPPTPDKSDIDDKSNSGKTPPSNKESNGGKIPPPDIGDVDDDFDD